MMPVNIKELGETLVIKPNPSNAKIISNALKADYIKQVIPPNIFLFSIKNIFLPIHKLKFNFFFDKKIRS